MNYLNLPPNVQQALRGIGVTAPSIASVLESSVPELVKTTNLSGHEFEILKKAVREIFVRPCFVSADDLYLENCDDILILRRLSLGCSILDHRLKGGIRSQGITEIYGESASGKTQICLQLCLMVQLPYHLGGLNGGAVYLCTEDKFPDKRLEQIKPQFIQRYQNILGDTSVGDNIYLNHVCDVKELSDVLENKLPSLMKYKKVKLLVIDSIAALFRVEYSMNEMDKRSKVLTKLGAQLMQLSNKNNMAVVCINQVSAVFYNTCKYHKVQPCLGQTWSNQVTVRVMLRRLSSKEMAEWQWPMEERNNQIRELAVIFSPDLPHTTCFYGVDVSGVHGVPADRHMATHKEDTHRDICHQCKSMKSTNPGVASK
ncbi:DNA repair protein XRCC3-like [Dendronephthya gigantea]|uniref:DNA repair protein XRCC3-like n=1 Tax=Dendronephthya gigantea TaxID=151771 RepID=UPI00106D9C9A|nr:DNA repair protein XRCC3-like [Dendronephthya gigantea]